MQIKMTNGGTADHATLAKELVKLAEWLQDRADEIYACDCEDDTENIRGFMEYDTGAYIHHDDCPTWLEHHHNIIICSVANYLKTLV